jgi:serine protease Do
MKLISSLLCALLLLPACTLEETKLAEETIKSTVVLHVKGRLPDGHEGWGSCSGVYIKNDTILTAAHCFQIPEDGAILQIWIRNIYGISAPAFVSKIDPTKDLALVQTNLKGRPVRFAKHAQVGETVYAVGNPLGLEFIITKGIISRLDFVFAKRSRASHIIFDASILPGNSGGALFNAQGRLIGIAVRSTSALGVFGAVGIGFAVDMRTIREFLK